MIDDLTRRLTEAAQKMMSSKPTLPFDPFAIARASGDFAIGLAMRPQDLMQVQMDAAKQWGDYWMGALSGEAGDKPRDRRFAGSAGDRERVEREGGFGRTHIMSFDTGLRPYSG